MSSLPVQVVVPPSRLDTTTKDHLTQQVKQLASQQALLVLLDMSKVEFVDSSGLGAMVAALKSLRSVGGIGTVPTVRAGKNPVGNYRPGADY